jgi:Laminin EGF domain
MLLHIYLTKLGQCKCRPGVIGRRCDSCSNRFAEVTLNGCEGILLFIVATNKIFI